VDGDTLIYSIVAQGSNGTASVVAGKLRYVPSANTNGTDGFTYRASDGSAFSAPASVAVTVTPVNDAPTCAAVALSTSEDVAGETDPLCSDVEGDTLTYSIVAQPSNGTASVVAGKLRYTPDPSTNGADSFTYKAADGATDSNVATVSVSVSAVNNAPVARNVAATTAEDTAKALTLDASDIDGDPLGYTIVSSPSHGALSGTGASRTYTPNANYNGPDSFTYRASDGIADSNVATVTLTVTAVNDAPVANDLTSSTSEDTPKAVTLSAGDVDGDPLGYTIVSGPSHGALSGTGANRTYTPNTNYNGPDSFTYRASDGMADSNLATVSLTVSAVNDAPSCPAQSLTIDEDTTGNVTPVCTDPEGDPISLEIVNQALNGTASVVGSTLRFIPFLDANGADSFTYRGRDGALASSAATVSVTVRPVNDVPQALSADVVTDKGVAKVVTLSGIDFDNDPLTFRIVSLPPNGGLRAGPNASDHLISAGELPYSLPGNQVRYEPNAGFTGLNAFQFRAHDGLATSLAADVRIDVLGVNVAPVCSSRTVSLGEDTGASGTACSDADGDALTFTRTGASHGELTLFSDGTFSYVPNANYHGSDSFTVVARDPSGLTSALATVTLTITPVNDAPTCDAVTLTTFVDTPGTASPDCIDVDGDSLTYEIVDAAANGTATVNGQQLDYVPGNGYSGADAFTYRAGDGALFSGAANVSVTVNP
jgi:VCBS repeat-containing protein